MSRLSTIRDHYARATLRVDKRVWNQLCSYVHRGGAPVAVYANPGPTNRSFGNVLKVQTEKTACAFEISKQLDASGGNGHFPPDDDPEPGDVIIDAASLSWDVMEVENPDSIGARYTLHCILTSARWTGGD